MQTFILFLKAFLNVALVLLSGYLIGWLLGNTIIGVLIALAFALLWHIFSGQKLLVRINKNKPKASSFASITHDSQIFAKFLDMENSLQESSQQVINLNKMLQESADALPHGVIVINELSEVLWLNRRATEYIGVSDPADIGKRIASLIHDLHFINLLDDGNDQDVEKSIEIDGPINKNMRLRLSFKLFADQYRMIAIEDITNFSRVDKMRQDFIGNASHELRTPLTVIRGYLEEMLDDEKIPGYWGKPMQAMEKQVLRMQNIIEDMLTLSNIESRLSLAGQERVHLKSLLENISQDLLLSFKDSHNIIQDIPDEVFIKGNEAELYSIFSNLIKNAFLYSPKHTDVRIEWGAQNGDYRIAVIDKGPGIPKASIRRLTERFYRVDMDRSRKRGGTGLGLAIVKHALMRHEAFLNIKSDEGKGSRFICHFPKQRVVI